MAIVLSDLPIEIDNKDSPKQRDGFGASWWFIACDTDDHYIEIVDEVVSMCSVEQIRELAYMKNPAGDTLVSMAAPECKEILQSSLRYIGRFEVKEVAIADSLASGITVFEAVDYGYTEDGLEDGIDVYLKFFSDKATYETEVSSKFFAWRGVCSSNSQLCFRRQTSSEIWIWNFLSLRKFLRLTLKTWKMIHSMNQENFACVLKNQGLHLQVLCPGC